MHFVNYTIEERRNQMKPIDKFCDLLKQADSNLNDMRIGQLIINMIANEIKKSTGEYIICPELYYIEDDRLINAIEKQLNRIEKGLK